MWEVGERSPGNRPTVGKGLPQQSLVVAKEFLTRPSPSTHFNTEMTQQQKTQNAKTNAQDPVLAQGVGSTTRVRAVFCHLLALPQGL